MDHIVAALEDGTLPPWHVERELAGHGPECFFLAAEARRAFLEHTTGIRLRQLALPERPYRALFECSACSLTYDLVAWDERRSCSICGGSLLSESSDPQPLVASYIGGVEDFYSYAGSMRVAGDVNATFHNILQYGTGLGPVGATRGCFLAERMGGISVVVGAKSRALRSLCLDYESETERDRAWKIVMQNHRRLEEAVAPMLAPWHGVLAMIEPMRTTEGRDHRLWLTFIADFSGHRGHHAISKAVGSVLPLVRSLLSEADCPARGLYIAQGYDGDLKPSPRNFRGRYVRASVRASLDLVEKACKVDPATLLRFVRIDAEGTRKLGHPGHTGMGGEILPACYKATKINPHSPLVSATEAIQAEITDGELEYAVEMPNVEAGVLSTQEGLIPPVGREIIELIGLRDSRDFAAWVAGLVLAAELNLSIEIARGKLYAPAE